MISGIAHACPGEGVGEHVHVQADASPGKAQLLGLAVFGSEATLDDGAPLPGSDGCVKVRGDNSQSAVKLQVGWDLIGAVLTPGAVVGWSQSAALVQVGSAFGNARHALSGPPLRVLYSRLAL